MTPRSVRRGGTMAAIAELAGVSVTTVSHVVNRTRRVAPATEEAVLRAIAQSGYRPDQDSRSGPAVSPPTVGVALPAMPDSGLGELVGSLRRAAAAAGSSLLLAETHGDEAGQLRSVMQLLSRQVDAVVLAPVADPAPVLEHSARRKVPVVLLDRPHGADVDQVGVESVRSTALLVRHLVELGHEHIGLVAGQPGLSTTEDRELGYRLGLRESGLPVDDALVVCGAGTDDGAARAVAGLLALAPRPTAVVVGGGEMTVGAMRGLRDAGVSVPGEMAFVGFGDFAWADLFHPRLTVIRPPVEAVGQQALELLSRRLREPEAPVRRILLEPEFVHRDSCGCHG